MSNKDNKSIHMFFKPLMRYLANESHQLISLAHVSAVLQPAKLFTIGIVLANVLHKH